MMSRLRDERGVAALTLLLVTAVLAVAGGMVLVASTTELEIGTRDRRAEEAFSSAEGGLDLATAHLLRQPTFAEGQTEECLDNPLVPASANITCEVRITSPTNGQIFFPATGRPFIEYTVMSKAKKGPSVVRTLVETFKLDTADVPYGFFIDGDADFGGTTNVYNESMLVNGNVTSRNNISFDADGVGGQLNDPDLGWRFHQNRIQSDPAPAMCPPGGTIGCAAVYSNFQIYSKQLLFTSEIHSSGTLSQTFANDRDVHQTKVVNGEALPVVTLPTNSVLEMMDTVKPMAEQQGMYRHYKNGTAQTILIQSGKTGENVDTTQSFNQNVVVYIDADESDTIKWQVNLIPNTTQADQSCQCIKYVNNAGNRVGSLSGIIVVRGGALDLESNTQWSGAIFAPEKGFRLRGGANCTCTIYAKGFSSPGGGSTVRLTSEWFSALPSGFATATRTGFFECEPFQSYPAGSKCAGA